MLSLELRRNQFIVRYVYRRNGTNVSAVRCRGNKIFFRHFNFLATGKWLGNEFPRWASARGGFFLKIFVHAGREMFKRELCVLNTNQLNNSEPESTRNLLLILAILLFNTFMFYLFFYWLCHDSGVVEGKDVPEFRLELFTTILLSIVGKFINLNAMSSLKRQTSLLVPLHSVRIYLRNLMKSR